MQSSSDKNDDYIVPVIYKRQRILSTSDGDNDFPYQCTSLFELPKKFIVNMIPSSIPKNLDSDVTSLARVNPSNTLNYFLIRHYCH